MKKHADMSQEQAEFVVMTGLTFDKKKFEEYRKGNLDWYYPKGAAFNDEEANTVDIDEDTTFTDQTGNEPSEVTVVEDNNNQAPATNQNEIIGGDDDENSDGDDEDEDDVNP